MVIAPELPAPYTARALRPDDARAVTSLLAAYEERLLGEALVDLEDVQADWQRPSTDLGIQVQSSFTHWARRL
ncbi:hypothetical protein BH20ACT6_BH20ACT6_20890 [soil metagenome]